MDCATYGGVGRVGEGGETRGTFDYYLEAWGGAKGGVKGLERGGGSR